MVYYGILTLAKIVRKKIFLRVSFTKYLRFEEGSVTGFSLDMVRYYCCENAI